MNRERIKGHLDLLLLSVLAAGPAHGYAIISALRERSEGTFDLPEGTIYPALHRLEDAQLLSSSWAAGDGRRRRVYALTSAGATALAAEQTEWHRFSHGLGAVRGVVDVTLPDDPVEEYLDQLHVSLRTTPREARRIIAEAEDHLRESVAAGLAAGLTEREAQEAAISSFGSVRAVVRAHARRVPPAAVFGELVMAAWKLTTHRLLAVAGSGLVALTS